MIPLHARWRAVLATALGFSVTFAIVFFSLPEHTQPEVVGVTPPLPPDEVATHPSGTLLPPPVQEVDAPTSDPEAAAIASKVVLPNSPGEATGTASAPIGVLLWGTVSLPDGTPLFDARISTLGDGGENLSVHADELGRYTLGPVSPGERMVRAWARFHHGDERALDLDPGVELYRQDFVMRPEQRIVVRVITSGGEPTFEVFVDAFRYDPVPVATRDDPGEVFLGVVGSLNNPFGIGSFWHPGQAGLPDMGRAVYGIVTLHEDPPAWLSFVASHQVLAKQRIDASTDEVTFVLGAEDFQSLHARVHGRLVDAESGESIPGTVNVSEYRHPMRPGHETESDGVFTITDAAVGRQYLVIRAPGHASVVIPINLSPGKVHEAGEILLHHAVSLSGSVHLDSGAPLEAVIECGRLEPSTGKVDWFQGVLYGTEEDGTFTIGGLEPGFYVLRSPGLAARSPRPHDPRLMSFPVRVAATSGEVKGIEVVLVATIPITLVAENVREPWPVVTARDSAGLPVRRAYPGRWGTETVMYLPKGEFNLETVRDGIVLERRTLVVSDQPQRLDFSFD